MDDGRVAAALNEMLDDSEALTRSLLGSSGGHVAQPGADPDLDPAGHGRATGGWFAYRPRG